jgi:hypothetical protein
MRQPKWPWRMSLFSLLIWLAAPTFLNAEVYPSAITIRASQSTRAPTCAKFASSCAVGGLCTDTVLEGRIKGPAVGKGKAEIDVARGTSDQATATTDVQGCSPVYLDICFSTGAAPGEEIVAQLTECPGDDTDANDSDEVSGGYQLVKSSQHLTGWGQVSGTAQMTSSPQTMRLTLSGIIEH